MKNILLMILILVFTSCNSDKKTNGLIGTYLYISTEQSENHYIIIDTLNGKYNGLYFGTEDSGGHGVFFYKNQMENLYLDNNKIDFEIGVRDLYESTRFGIDKHNGDSQIDSTSGISKTPLKYSGEILKNGFKLNCESEYGDCWESEMTFTKLTE